MQPLDTVSENSTAKWYLFAVPLALLLYLIFALSSVFTREPTEDESWFGTATYNLATKGTLSSDVLEGAGTWREGMRRHMYWQPPLSFVVNAGLVKLLGFSLFTIRGASVFWGLVALVSAYVLVVTLSGSYRAGVLAMVFVGTDYFFLLDVSDGRMDAMCFALGIASLAVYLRLRQRNLRLAVFLSQCLVVCSGLTHPNGIIWFLCLITLTVWLDRKRMRTGFLALALLPYIVGAAGWGAFILEDPHDFWVQFSNNARVSGTSNQDQKYPLSNPGRAIMTEIRGRYLASFGLAPGVAPANRLKAVVLVIYLGGCVAALTATSLRRTNGVSTLLLLITVVFLTLTFVIGNKMFYYLIHILPLFGMLLAIVMDQYLSRGRIWQALCAVTMFVLIGVQLGGLLYRLRKNSYHHQYLPAVQAVKACSRPGQLVLGSAAFFWNLHGERQLIDDVQLGFISHVHPDVVVISPFYRFLENQPATPALADWYRLKRVEYGRASNVGDYEIYCQVAKTG